MTILKIFEYPHSVLSAKSEDITSITEELKILAADMIETMYEAQGIGLASNQVGVLQRIIVIDLQEEDVRTPYVMINPIITKKSEELFECEEGCLSIMPVKALLRRPKRIEVTYMDLDGNIHNIIAENLFSVCIQHEIDHLNGILFIDHLSKLKKDIIIRKFKKIKSQNNE